ncbi:MAG: sensor histidine kinase N-terminal domain-containing protein [Burkholderiales bacterium]|nr:sensor histidine kinase N-terminal domain-containing protein [Burkholderiales bacterium]
MRRWPRSLQGRVLALVLGLVAAVWGAAAAWTWHDARRELDELLDGHLAQAAALLVLQQARAPHDDERAVDAPTLHRYAPQVAFQVFHEGRLALRSAQAPMQPMVALERARPGAASVRERDRHGKRVDDEPRHDDHDDDPDAAARASFHTTRLDGVPWRVFAAAGSERDILVLVGERLDARAAILRAVLRSTLAPLLVALPLLALGAWWAVAGGLRPLARLGRALAGRAPQALDPVTLDDAPAEMRPMVDALNGLLQRIGGLLQAERRFTADAAHELRTPIAAIRAQAQVALGETDDAARRHALQATLAGCDRATRLGDQMLTLARLEAGAAPARAALDLAALARQEAAALGARALARGQALELAADAPCPVRGDTTLLAVLVRNLVDNAIRYAPQGARIAVAVEPAGGAAGRAAAARTALLTVEDSGPGLEEADLARLGERFFRVLGSGQAGSGLGWSIVQRIAAAHGARVTADRSPTLGGLRVRVEVPQAAPSAADEAAAGSRR